MSPMCVIVVERFEVVTRLHDCNFTGAKAIFPDCFHHLTGAAWLSSNQELDGPASSATSDEVNGHVAARSDDRGQN